MTLRNKPDITFDRLVSLSFITGLSFHPTVCSQSASPAPIIQIRALANPPSLNQSLTVDAGRCTHTFELFQLPVERYVIHIFPLSSCPPAMRQRHSSLLLVRFGKQAGLEPVCTLPFWLYMAHYPAGYIELLGSCIGSRSLPLGKGASLFRD